MRRDKNDDYYIPIIRESLTNVFVYLIIFQKNISSLIVLKHLIRMLCVFENSFQLKFFLIYRVFKWSKFKKM